MHSNTITLTNKVLVYEEGGALATSAAWSCPKALQRWHMKKEANEWNKAIVAGNATAVETVMWNYIWNPEQNKLNVLSCVSVTRFWKEICFPSEQGHVRGKCKGVCPCESLCKSWQKKDDACVFMCFSHSLVCAHLHVSLCSWVLPMYPII